MLRFIEKFVRRHQAKTYEEQRETLAVSKTAKRLNLAKNKETSPEILYYLAENDESEQVRMAAVNNESLPLQVAPSVAKDAHAGVRMTLAERLVDLLPDLSDGDQSELYGFVLRSLGALAVDESIKVREALASTLKDYAYTPPEIANQLARDVERTVSEPILRFCVALSDEDLLEVLSAHPEDWVVEAVAERKTVSELVSDAVAKTDSVSGGVALINNEGAQISEGTLKYIVERSKDLHEWQKPMALRKGLPLSVAKQMAEFVDDTVRSLLVERWDFNAEETAEIINIFQRRMEFAAGHPSDEDEDEETAQARLEKLLSEGDVGEDQISDALAMKQYNFVYLTLAHMLDTELETVRMPFTLKDPAQITALCWKAGLSMRMALHLQQELGSVSESDLLSPKDGDEYPMGEDELNDQLELLGLAA